MQVTESDSDVFSRTCRYRFTSRRLIVWCPRRSIFQHTIKVNRGSWTSCSRNLVGAKLTYCCSKTRQHFNALPVDNNWRASEEVRREQLRKQTWSFISFLSLDRTLSLNRSCIVSTLGVIFVHIMWHHFIDSYWRYWLSDRIKLFHKIRVERSYTEINTVLFYTRMCTKTVVN